MEELNIFADELVQKLLDEAAVAAANSGIRTNMGRLTLRLRYLQWVNSMPTEVSIDKYRELGKRERSMELTVMVDIQELNPSLDFEYERRVMMHSKDWFEHWQRSLIEYFELDNEITDESLSKKERQIEMNKLVMTKTGALAGKYVLLADEEQSKQKDTDKIYRTPALLAVYDSREECFDAYEERFGKRPAGAAPVAKEAPDGFDTYDEFLSTVISLRDAGMDNREISKEIGVSVLEVVNAK